MKKALFTIHIKRPGIPYELSVAYDLSLKLKRNYAKKIGAELVVADKKIFTWTQWESPERLRMYNLFDIYDRILYVDGDVLIKPDAPDIFETFPNEQWVYMLRENPPDEKEYKSLRGEAILGGLAQMKLHTKYGISNDCHYLNAGIILVSKRFKEMFKYDKSKYFETIRMEQDYLNLRMLELHYPAFYLPIEFNGMILLVKEPDYLSRCHFIHYIGCESRGGRAKCMIQDYQEIIKRGLIKE